LNLRETNPRRSTRSVDAGEIVRDPSAKTVAFPKREKTAVFAGKNGLSALVGNGQAVGLRWFNWAVCGYKS
jgi:hypothetical protein